MSGGLLLLLILLGGVRIYILLRRRRTSLRLPLFRPRNICQPLYDEVPVCPGIERISLFSRRTMSGCSLSRNSGRRPLVRDQSRVSHDQLLPTCCSDRHGGLFFDSTTSLARAYFISYSTMINLLPFDRDFQRILHLPSMNKFSLAFFSLGFVPFQV